MKPSVLKYFLATLILFTTAHAQKKYPSLFWEISGNGLKKPSYLFGTMHVSNKMAFHLSDSFYYAMRNADAVALELNPEVWQDQMFRMQKAQANLARFSSPSAMNDYLKERSFQLQKYEDDLRRALIEEPTIVNNLLYRSYHTTADFEENTYLDLYIYQTGRKLGKKPAGVEDFVQSEKLMMEAYRDMAKEKSRRTVDTDGQSPYQIQKTMQEAYRKGDLDLMDSLETLTITSPAFTEKFLYIRNEIQANSIDTILKRQSLFVGVGAAHLPGPRGIIELLRKKGYRLRPIFMQDRNAIQKEEIDKMKVPVTFQKETTEDGMVTVQLPGKLYRREDARGNESWQYADMNNGSYYMLTRVSTHAPMFGQNEKNVFAKIDSMLYENIPGRIIKKSVLTKNGLAGFDITNRTRRGDLQRYQIIVSPFEVFVFKMSGNDNYVDGKEAETFFNSIQLKLTPSADEWIQYQPKYGGFTVRLPHTANEKLNKKTPDRIDRLEYEAVDNKNGNAYMVWRKSVYNLNFLEEDTFDIGLIEESFQKSELINKRVSRKIGVENNLRFLESKYSLTDGGYLTARAFVKGPHYYLLAARTTDKKADFSPFFKSFQFTSYRYPSAQKYIDSSLSLYVSTSVKPDVDTLLRPWMEKSSLDAQAALSNSSSLPKNKNGLFKNDSTGESILVSVESFPKYYFSRDTSKFWKERLEDKARKDMVISKKEFFRLNDSVTGYKLILTDTNSTRQIVSTYILKDNSLFQLSTITDTSAAQSNFINEFFATARPIEKRFGPSVFKNKLDLFFDDFTSKDSVTMNEARQSVSSLYYGKEGVDKIMKAITNLKYGDKDYFDIKSRFIIEMGYIDDSTSKDRLVETLRDLYNKTADTAYFQNAVLNALARLQTKSSFTLLKDLLAQDPPVFDNPYEYSRLFSRFNDSLRLAKTLFPEILQLASLEDYKPHINSLLKAMVDSGYLNAIDYDSYFSKLLFDAKVQLKKQQSKDEKKLQQEEKEEEINRGFNFRNIFTATVSSNYNTNSVLLDYALLLAPFYDRYNTVPKFFDKLLSSKDVGVQIGGIRALLLNNKRVSDSLLSSIAASDRHRVKLLTMLEKIGKKHLFPSKYKNQEAIARSFLFNEKSYKQLQDLQLVDKQVTRLKGDKGVVYLYKYKVNKEDEWKMGISGIQPLDAKEISSKVELVKLTDRRLRPNQPVNEQFEQQLKRLLFAQHKSARQFFETSGSLNYLLESFGD